MVFYKGALSYTDLLWMPLPELLLRKQHAEKIIKEQAAYREATKNGRKF